MTRERFENQYWFHGYTSWDMMATKIEFDEWKRGYTVKVEEKKEEVDKKTEQSKKELMC